MSMSVAAVDDNPSPGGRKEGELRGRRRGGVTSVIAHAMEGKPRAKQICLFSASTSAPGFASASSIHSLDDGCLMHIFSFLNPIPDRYNTALVCHRWRHLACHPHLWLRVERSINCSLEPGVYPSLETAIFAARPGDTILIAAGGNHLACNIQIKKPLCLIGGGDLPEDTILTCSRGSDSAIEFLSTCKVANLTVRAELGCCFLHRRGRLTIEACLLQCEENPLDYLSCAIVSTATNFGAIASVKNPDHVTVMETRIEGGAKAVVINGTLSLQHVRAIYARTAVFFWFEVGGK